MVGRADEVEDQMRRQAPLVLEIRAQRIAIAVRAPAVVVRGRETDCGAIRRRLRARGVVREEGETQGAASVGTPFGNERRAGLR